MLSHITTWHERLPRARSFLCYSSLKPKISPSNTLRLPGSSLPRPAFHSFLFPQDWLMIIQGSGLICQLSSSYPLPALDWTLRHLSAICQSHTDRLTDNGSLTQSLGTATFLTSLEFIHARTPLALTYSPATFTWMSPCVTRIHCYPGYLAIITPDPGPFCDHSQRLPMVLTSHGVTTHCGSLTHFQRTSHHLNDYRVDRTSYNSHLGA